MMILWTHREHFFRAPSTGPPCAVLGFVVSGGYPAARSEGALNGPDNPLHLVSGAALLGIGLAADKR